MKIDRKTIVAFAVVAVILYLLNSKLTPPSADHGNGTWAVYGTNGCGWTRKQLDHMKNNNIPHTYIDCDKEDCKGINAYPTMKSPNGQTITGFKQVQ